MKETRTETTLAQERLHWGVFILPMLVVLALFLVTLLSMAFLHFITRIVSQLNPQFNSPFGGLFIWILVLPEILIGFPLLLVTWVAYLKSNITLTDRRLIFRTGWLTRVKGELPLENVDAIIFTEPLLGRFLGYGTVLVTSLGGLRFPFCYIASPQSFHATLQKAVTTARSSTRLRA